MAIQEVLVSKIFNYTSEPTKKVEGQFWFNSSTNVLSRYNGTVWKPITVSSDDVAVLSDGSKISLTNYLNTQIAALAEGIDTKQDKLTYYSENTKNNDSSISAPYVNLEAVEYVNIKGQSAIELTTDTSTSHILLSAGDQSIKLNDGDLLRHITINGSLSGTAISTKIHSWDMSSNTRIPSEHAVAEALLDKQNKLSTYKETVHSLSNTTGDKVIITATPYNVTNPGSIILSAINKPGYPGVINLKADDIQFNDKSFTTIQSEINEKIAASKPKFYSEVDLDSSHPDSSGNYGKYATIDTSADFGGSSIVNINTKSLYEGTSEINLHTDNTYNASLISLSAHSGQNGGGGNSKISLAAVNDEYDGSQITKSYNSNIDVDCKSITLSSNALSIKLDGYSQSTPGIYINGELRGSSISTSIPTSNAVDTKVTSEKAVKTELDKKQDKLLYYSEVSGDNPSVTISVANIKLEGKVAEGSNTTASGYCSHAEGSRTTASGTYSHAEGSRTTASGMNSHAEGNQTTASGTCSHAEGDRTTASDPYSHAEGYDTKASSDYQHAQGKYNIEDANNKYADIIGNGISSSARSNAATVSWDGISWSQTDVRAGGTDQDSATYSLSALSEGVNNKQDKLAFYHEETSTNQEASILGANSFSIKNTNQGLILDSNNGGITITNGNFNTGQAVISIVNNNWENNSDAILFDVDGNGVKISDALKIPEIKNKQDKLLYYSEVSGSIPSATISVKNIKLNGSVAEGQDTTASGESSHAEGYNTTASGYYSHAEGRYTTASSSLQHVQGIYNIEDANDKYADIIGNGSEDHGVSNAQTVSWEGISWSQTDVRAGGTDQDNAIHSLAAKQNSTDNTLETIDKTIVGAINEINSIFNVNALPTPITDVKTITTTLENLITDTQYANKPGTILINPNIKNTGAILVGEAITDISKAFPIYTDQPVTIAFKNINDFKVAGENAGESFNYIISFGYINQNITSDSLTIATNNGVYTITPEGDAGFETLKISKIS